MDNHTSGHHNNHHHHEYSTDASSLNNHLHVWALSTTENAMTVYAVLESSERLDEVIYGIREVAKKQGISHSTIEGETPECHCTDTKMLEAD